MRTTRSLLAQAARRLVLPVLPTSYHLPFRYRVHIAEGLYENELKFLDRIIRAKDVAIDVGANEGMFTYRLSKLFAKVYAFEINSELTKNIEYYNKGNIEVINTGLSCSEEDVTLYIPVLKGFPLTGWASLTPGNCPDTQEHIEKPVSVRPLDAFELQRVSFIKIDVEGHEMDVLTGASRTIERDRPTVLIEVRQHNLKDVSTFFANLGYQQRTLEELAGIAGSEGNHIFLPE